MIAVLEARNLIRDLDLSEIGGVYAYSIPREVLNNVDKNIVLITDANSSIALEGSNDFYGLDRMIEVQVFYALHPGIDPESLEVQLYKAFVHAGWTIGQNRGHQRDPDTGQIYTTFYVSNLELLKN